MSMYVAPEQMMKDRADFARKGISRGRSAVVLRYRDGICFVAENRSRALHKISEIYDRIGFAAVGRYNEFENLRIAGIRYADMRGYSYDRVDVTGRSLANSYAQVLGSIFSSSSEKPYEVELVVAELGETTESDQIYRLTYDGSVGDEKDFAVMGGQAEEIAEKLHREFSAEHDLARCLRTAVAAFRVDEQHEGVGVNALEVAILDRTRPQPRKFRRITEAQLRELLGDDDVPEQAQTDSSSQDASSRTDGGTEQQ